MKKALNIITIILFMFLIVSSVLSIKSLLKVTELHNDIVGGYEILYEVDGSAELFEKELEIKLDELGITEYLIINETENIRLSIREVTDYTGENINAEIKNIENNQFEISEISINNYEDVTATNSNLLVITIILSYILISFFMVFYYRQYGVIASLALIIYVALTLLLLNMFNEIITVPALGALLFGLGVAIDSAIIIFERIKEKLHENRNIKYAVENGNKYSLKSIIDGNITTIIIGVILIIFGGFYIKSFGMALVISLVSSTVIMVLILKVVLESLSNITLLKNRPDLIIGYVKNKKKTIHFMKQKNKYFKISGYVILAGMIIMVLFRFNTSIDLNGGTEIIIDDTNNIEEIMNEFLTLGYEPPTAENNKLLFDYKLENVERETIVNMLETKYQLDVKVNLADGIMQKMNISLFIITMISSIGLIFLYLWYRFDLKSAISATVAVIHDILIVTAVFSIFGLEINTLFLISLLIIVGYSVNDSIILFDRIRENINRNIKEKENIYPYSIVNRSITETLGRTFSTSITTLLPIIMLMILLTGELRLFAIAIALGVIIGTYSSITIASGLWLDLTEKN